MLVFNRDMNHGCITCRYPVSVTVCSAEQHAPYSLLAEPGIHTPYLFPHLSSTYISTQRSIEVVGNTVCRRSHMCINSCHRRAPNNFPKTRRCWEDSFAWKLLWCLSLLVLPNYYFSTRCKGLVFNAISLWHIDVHGFASYLGHMYLGWLMKHNRCTVVFAFRGVLPSAECLSVISKPRLWGGPNRAVAPQKKIYAL